MEFTTQSHDEYTLFDDHLFLNWHKECSCIKLEDEAGNFVLQFLHLRKIGLRLRAHTEDMLVSENHESKRTPAPSATSALTVISHDLFHSMCPSQFHGLSCSIPFPEKREGNCRKSTGE